MKHPSNLGRLILAALELLGDAFGVACLFGLFWALLLFGHAFGLN